MNILKAGRLLCFLIASIFVMMLWGVVAADASVCTIMIDGKTISADAEPMSINDRTLVPASTIVNGLGGTSSWDQKTSTATFVKGSNTIKVTINSKKAEVNGKTVVMDVAPVLVVINSKGGARSMVPLRFIGENLGYDVGWDGSTKTVKITTPAQPAEPDPAPVTPVVPSTPAVTDPPAGTAVPAPVSLKTISSTKIKTGQKISGDTKNTYTNVEIKASESLKAGSYKGVWTNSNVYYIDFDESKLGTDASNKKQCSTVGSQVVEVRSGTHENNTVRIAVELKVKVTPAVSYSTDGATMILSFIESASATPSTPDTTTTPSTPSTPSVTDPEVPEGPQLKGSESLTDSGDIKRDHPDDFKPYADGKLVVCIDPGHESATAGKRSPDGSLLEWKFNRDVAYRLKSLLEAQGCTVIMTVPKDHVSSGKSEEYTLSKRVKTANSAGNVDIFVSIHANANGTGNDWDAAHGWEIWVHRTGGVSEKLAKSIESTTRKSVPEFTDRGIKKTADGSVGFYVSRNTTMPSVLIEHGFYTNKDECELMKTSEFKQRLAQADADGIMNFFKAYK